MCRKTRFSVFGSWWHNCKLCRRTVCTKCCTKVNYNNKKLGETNKKNEFENCLIYFEFFFFWGGWRNRWGFRRINSIRSTCRRWRGTVVSTLINLNNNRLAPSLRLSSLRFNWNCHNFASARPTAHRDRRRRRPPTEEPIVARVRNRIRRHRYSPVTDRRDANRRWLILRYRNSLTRLCRVINLCQPTTLLSGWLNWWSTADVVGGGEIRGGGISPFLFV